jgi:hypothetical protein
MAESGRSLTRSGSQPSQAREYCCNGDDSVVRWVTVKDSALDSLSGSKVFFNQPKPTRQGGACSCPTCPHG